MIKKYFDEFIGAWIVILILNQLFIFGCFKIHCILSLELLGGLNENFVDNFLKDKNRKEVIGRQMHSEVFSLYILGESMSAGRLPLCSYPVWG